MYQLLPRSTFLVTFTSLLIVSLLLAPTLTAQTLTGTITGVVSDQQGAVIPGAVVSALSLDTNNTYTTKASGIGAFTIPNLPRGSYRIEIQFQGFRTWKTTVTVMTAQTASFRAELEIGAVTEVIEVESASQETLQTTTSEVITGINRKQILELPISTRNPMNLVALQAGVTGRGSGAGGSRTMVVNGLRGNTNNVTQDGINVQDNFLRNDGFFAISALTVENTGEFTISTNNISSADGAGVAQIRVSTPRGSNDFHGSAFYFHRNDAFNATDFFNNLTGVGKEREREHRFGGRVGGPIWRDNTFFFFRYEGFRENDAFNRNRTVLTSSARQGLFSYVAGSAGTHPLTGNAFNAGDTITVDLFQLANTFGNRPGLTFNPFTMEFVDATPLPNNFTVGDGLNTGGHSFNGNGPSENDRYTIRVDHKFLDSASLGTHWVEVAWNFADFSDIPSNGIDAPFPEGVATACPGRVCTGDGQTSERKVLSMAIHSTFTPTLLNEARFGFNRAPVQFFASLSPATFPRSFSFNFPGVITDPENRTLPQGRISPVYTFIDNVTKVSGDHSFKFGVNFTSTSVINRNEAGVIPRVDIGVSGFDLNGNPVNDLPTSAFPGSSSGDRSRARQIYQIITGLISDTNQTFNAINATDGFLPGASAEDYYRERSLSLYFQDTWRFRPNLSLNFGLRYELIKPVDIVNGRGVQPIGGTDGLFIVPGGSLFQIDSSVTFADLLAGNVDTFLDVAGSAANNPFYSTDKNNFAPFVGIAWSMNDKTVIRVGGSMSYTRDGLVVFSNAVGANDGLTFGGQDSFANITLGTDVIDPSLNYTPSVPPLVLPISQLSNYLASGANSTVFTIDKDLKTPYVGQWNLAIQRELTPTTSLEVRYVGNRAVKLIRGIDFNQIDILGNGLLGEFQLAQSNLACNQANMAGSRFDDLNFACSNPLPILEAMDFPFWTSSTFVNPLNTGEVGQWAHDLQRFSTFFFLTGGSGGFPGLAAFPANFFRANPIIFNADSVGNHSSSKYHGLQVEMRRRMSNGLYYQGNYTFGKVLADFAGTSSEFAAFLDLRQPEFDRGRASFDITHTFNLNGGYEIPIGAGRNHATEGVIGKLLEGWQVGGLTTWRSGAPLSIYSGRGTLNRNGRSATRNGPVLVGSLNAAQVCSEIGTFKSDGVNIFSSALIDPSNGEGNPAVFGHPVAGQLGNQNLGFSGCDNPAFFDIDLNIIKRTSISETVNVEFRFEMFNVLNHANFSAGTSEDIDSSNFGRVTSQLGNPREIQFNLRINF